MRRTADTRAHREREGGECASCWWGPWGHSGGRCFESCAWQAARVPESPELGADDSAGVLAAASMAGETAPPWSHGTHRRRRGRQAVKDDWAAGNGTRKQPSSEPAPRVQGESEAFSSVSWRVEPRCPEPACRSEPAAPCALFGPRVSSLCRGFPRDQDGSAARSEFVGAVLVTPAQVKALGGDQPAVGFQCRSRCSDRRPCIGVRWPGASERGCHGTREGWGALQTGARGFECGPREDFQGHPSEVCACVWWEWEGQLSNGGKREEVQREPSFNDAGDPKAL